MEEGSDDKKSLREIKFQTGDFMDVAIITPRDRERAAVVARARQPPGRDGRDRGGRPWR
jgi:hypothetical protein